MHKIRNNLWKPEKREMLFFLFEIFILLAICVLHAMSFHHYVDFWPINGTFQNFNPVRRLLAGQIPYRDFQDYLGLGHLYSGTFFTFLFGGNYQASLFAFSFLSLGGLAMISLVIGNALFQRKSTVLAFTNLILVLVLTEPFLYTNVLAGTDEIKNALDYAVSSGNSARFIRGMILPVSCTLFYLVNNIGKKAKLYHRIGTNYREMSKLGVLGMIAGFSFLWSNDYGISCWVCLSIMTFFVVFARTRKLGKAIFATFFEVICSLVFLVLFAEIFTLGHFRAWFQSTFGTGGYQGWYYNSAKSYYLFDVDFSYIMILQALLCIVYLVRLFQQRASKYALKRYGVLAYVNMVGFCAVNEYHLLSGNDAREVALSVLFVSLFFEACRYLSISFKADRIRNGFLAFVSVMSLAWVVSCLKEEIVFWKISDRGGYT